MEHHAGVSVAASVGFLDHGPGAVQRHVGFDFGVEIENVGAVTGNGRARLVGEGGEGGAVELVFTEAREPGDFGEVDVDEFVETEHDGSQSPEFDVRRVP